MSRAHNEIASAIHELVVDGVRDQNELYDALLEKYGGDERRLSLRLHAWLHEELDAELRKLLADALSLHSPEPDEPQS